MSTFAVIYAAKSSEDRHGSIPDQIADCRALAGREGLEVVGEYSDEAKSAFKSNRGTGLVSTLKHAEREGAALIVQHSDRLARGDGDQARHLVELVLWARKAGVRLCSVQDPQTFDGMGLVYAALMGDRNFEDSARKSTATRAGLKRRAERGQPCGPVPVGFGVEHRPDGTTVRVIDPATRVIPELVFDVLEHGGTPGDAARKLNGLGHRGKRGGPFAARTVREIARNTAYSGDKGYPPIVSAARQQRVIASMRRMDPAAVQRRQGGRPDVADARYFLRDLAFCGLCGGSLWTRELAPGRMYICRNVRLSTGICNAEGILAEVIEGHVLAHVEEFVGDAERWLAERRDEHRRALEAQQEAVKRLQSALTDLDRQRDGLMASYRQQVAEGRSTAHLALEAVEQLDSERLEQAQRLADAEAIVAEHDLSPAISREAELVSSFRERMAEADSAPALHRALAGSLAGMWATVVNGLLHVEFEPGDAPEPDVERIGYLLEHAVDDEPDAGRADPYTLVQVQPSVGVRAHAKRVRVVQQTA